MRLSFFCGPICTLWILTGFFHCFLSQSRKFMYPSESTVSGNRIDCILIKTIRATWSRCQPPCTFLVFSFVRYSWDRFRYPFGTKMLCTVRYCGALEAPWRCVREAACRVPGLWTPARGLGRAGCCGCPGECREHRPRRPRARDSLRE